MEFISKAIHAYCLKNSSQESEVLQELDRETHVKHLSPRMLSGHLQGNFLSILSGLIQPNRILEIGTYTGYSAICLAAGLKKDGKLITIDVNEELEKITKKHFEKAGLSEKIEFKIGNALEIIPTLSETFDMVFIDADKKNYLNYFYNVKEKVSRNGLIIADNVLWSGKTVDEMCNDPETNCLREYNRVVASDPDFESVLLPVRDGLMLSRKK